MSTPPAPALASGGAQSVPRSRDRVADSDDQVSVPVTSQLPSAEEPARSAADVPPSVAPAEPATPSAMPAEPSPLGTATTLYQVIDIHRRSSCGIEGMMMTQEMRYQILARLAIGVPPGRRNASR